LRHVTGIAAAPACATAQRDLLGGDLRDPSAVALLTEDLDYGHP
jgi:hypothetical protein